MRLVIDLTDQQLAQLNSSADALGVHAEDLARAAVVDLVTTLSSDFKTAAQRVLANNAELYRRLG